MPTSCLRFGYANGTRSARPGRWPGANCCALTGASVVLADHAPTAILAARTLDMPVMLFGSGFFCPAAGSSDAQHAALDAVPGQRLLACDQLALASINAVLDRYGKPQLDHLAQLFQVAEDSLLSFPELDHYRSDAGRRATGACCPPPCRAGSSWPAAPGPRVFSYLRPETPHVEIWRPAGPGPRDLPRQHPDLCPRAAGEWSPHTLGRISFRRPVDLNKVAREADAGLTYASRRDRTAFLLAGKPVVMLPGHLEQFLFAKRVEEMGAGLIQNPEQAADGLAPRCSIDLMDESGLPRQRRAFAEKYAELRPDAVLANHRRAHRRTDHAGSTSWHAGGSPPQGAP
jgi:hypothetical protein